MSFSKGEYVVTLVDGKGTRVIGYDQVSYKAGDELVITAIRNSGWYNVRKSGGGHAFVMSGDKLAVRTRALGEAPEGAITPHDPRIAWFFEDAGVLATRMDLCAVYDTMMAELNAPGRERNWTVEIFKEDGMRVVATVKARSQFLAEQRIRATLTQPEQLQIGGPQ